MMDRQKALVGLQEWLFERMVRLLEDGVWKLRVRDFSKARRRKERRCRGLTNFHRKRIYLNLRHGTIRVLVHEFGHTIFRVILMGEMLWERNQKPYPTLKRLRTNLENRADRFERWFFYSMTPEQRKILAQFIRKARKRYARKLEKRKRR